MTQRMAMPEELRRGRIVAIVRGRDGKRLIPVCETLVANGIACLEVTTNTPGWQEAVTHLASQAGVLAGAGTVLTPEHVTQAAAAGARFVVSPDTDAAVGAAAREAGLGWFPGALTPTEIRSAWEAGATAVKVFPASALGGAGYLRAVRAPLPDIPLVPTGGIDVADVGDHLDAGAAALGVGSPLLGDALDGGSLEDLAARSRAFAEAVGDDG